MFLVFLIILYIVIDLMGAVLASLITVGVGRGGVALDEMEWPLPADCRFLRLPSNYLCYFTLGFLDTKGRESYLE